MTALCRVLPLFLLALSLLGTISSHSQASAGPLSFSGPATSSQGDRFRAPRFANASWGARDGNGPSLSVPDGVGGHYIAWADTRDGTSDLFLLRVSNTGVPELGWPADGVAVCSAPGQQAFGALFPDGAGGVILGWLDGRDDWLDLDAYAQRVDPNGVPQWTANGVKVLEGGPDLIDVTAAPDGVGGVLVAWSVGSVDPNLYALRLTGAGTIASGWDPGGELVCDDPAYQLVAAVTADGTGGAVVAWHDDRGITGGAHAFAQRLDASGSPQWTANGIQVDASVPGVAEIALCPGSGGHVLVFWVEESAGPLYGQRLDASGTPQWASPVALHPPVTSTDDGVEAVADGSGGAVVAWEFYDGNRGIRAQRIDGAGAIHWGADGATIVDVPNAFPSTASFLPDGSGGAYFAWGDRRNDVDFDVYAQHVAGNGTVDWTADGVPVAALAGQQLDPIASPDGLGGVLISWPDSRTLDTDIYTQRLNSAGVAQLTANGEPTFVNPGVQSGPMLVPTTDGGALAVWAEKRLGRYDLRARKLNPDGSTAGFPTLISTLAGNKIPFGFIPDGAGGGIVGWFGGPDRDIFAQRIDGNAAPLWTANGAAACLASGFQGSAGMVSDGAGGAIFAWYDARVEPNPDIYAQRIDGAGVALWGVSGTPVCADPGVQDGPVIASDGAGGAIVAWPDRRSFMPLVYAQRVDAAGTALWAPNGLQIADYSGSPFAGVGVRAAVPGGANEAIVLIVVSDFNVVLTQGFNILHAQKVNGAGAPQWGTEGSALCDAGSFTFQEMMVGDGFGGAFVAWSDARNGTWDIYGQRVNTAGGVIWDADGTVVCDAPSWQTLGGITRFNNDPIFSWSDERSGMPDVYAHRMTNAGADVWTADGVVVSDEARGQYVASLAPWVTAAPERFFVGFTDNRAGDARYVFVQRLDSNGGSVWTLDGVTEAQIALASFEASPERVLLVWHSSENVTATIYRRLVEGDWTAIGTASADGTGRIEFEDTDVVPGGRYGYRLGIPGATGEVFRGEAWIDVPSQLALALHGLQPSPAVRDLVVSFTLPRRDDARIELLDLAGRRVLGRDLVDFAPGRHTLRLDGTLPPSGMYFLRLTQNERTVTARAPVMK